VPDADRTTPPLVVSESTGTPHCSAAALSSRCRASAAAVRTGVYIERIVLDPPVSWLNTSSGRASASEMSTWPSGRSSSSATSIAIAVVMP
jgi:hypothetical protein